MKHNTKTMKFPARATAIALLLALALGGCGANDAQVPEELRRAGDGMVAQAGLAKGDTLLNKQDILPAGNALSDWVAIAFALSGRDDDYEAYRNALEAYVTAAYATETRLDRYKATEWHRISLTVLALGGDPTRFGTAPNGSPINLIADGTYSFNGKLSSQGNNALIFALITLDALDYEVPAGSTYTRESILAELLATQSGDGGFGLTIGSSDVDITAMALTALAGYTEDVRVEQAISAGLDYLSSQQQATGDYISYGERNSESVSQTIIALCALGIDPATDERFIKNGVSLRDALLAYQNEDGAFRHLSPQSEPADIMPTEQAMLAIIAMERLGSGGPVLYDFTGYTAPG